MSGASYPQPNRNPGGIYNPSYFQSSSTQGLTLDEANNLYLRLSGGAIVGSLSVGGVLSGKLDTGAQTNITQVGTLSSLSVNGTFTLNGTPVSDFSTITLPDYCKTITPGTAAASKCLVLDASSNLSGFETLTGTSINATITKASQPNITSLGNLTVNDTSTSGATVALTLLHTLSSGSPANGIGVALDFKSLSSTSAQVSYGRMYAISTDITNGAVSGYFLWKPMYNNAYVQAMTLTPNSSSTSTLAISGTVSATTLTGTLSTAAQGNITSLGTLTSLTVSGALNGTLSTAAQPNITSIGTLTSLTISGALNATISTASQPNITSLGTLTSLTISGALNATISTASQPNITSLGTLTSLTVGTTTITDLSQSLNPAYCLSITPGTCSASKCLVVDASSNISGIGTLTATTLTGTLSTASQPNITSLGTLTSLTVSGALNGTLSTASQPNITSLGALTGLTVNSIDTNYNIGVLPLVISHSLSSGTAAIGIATGIDFKAFNDASSSVSYGRIYCEATSVSSGSHAGKFIFKPVFNGLTMSAMTITPTSSTVATVAVSGTLTATTLTGTISTASQPSITSLGTLTSLTVSGGITGTLSTASQPNITSLGTLTSLTVSGGITASTFTGTIQTSSQPNITAIGTLTSLTVGTTTITDLNQVTIPVYCQSITAGTCSASKCLVVDASKNITGIGSISCSTASFTKSINSDTDTQILTITKDKGTTSADTNSVSIPFYLNRTDTSALFQSGVIKNMIITAGGTLTNCSNLMLGASYNGTIYNGVQITAYGVNQNALTITGKVVSDNFYGNIATASQPSITSLGNLTALQVNGTTITDISGVPYVNSVSAGTCSASKALIVDSSKNITGINRIEPATIKASTYTYICGNGQNSPVSGSGLNIRCNGGVFASFIENYSDYSTNTRAPIYIDGSYVSIGQSPAGTSASLELGYNSISLGDYVFYARSGNSVNTGYFSGSGSSNVSLRTSGRIVTSAELDITSDRRLKRDIEALETSKCVKFVKDMSGFSYLKGTETKRQIGVIAQDIFKNGDFTELLNFTENKDMKIGDWSPEGAEMSVSYNGMIPILIEVNKHLLKENEELTTEIDTLKYRAHLAFEVDEFMEKENKELKKEIEELKNEIKKIKEQVNSWF